MVQDGLSSTLDGAVYFDKGQAVTVIASVSDSEYTTTSESDAVLILNTAPEAPEVSLGRELGCDEGWSMMGDGERCVKMFDDSSPNWHEAQASCEAMVYCPSRNLTLHRAEIGMAHPRRARAQEKEPFIHRRAEVSHSQAPSRRQGACQQGLRGGEYPAQPVLPLAAPGV